MMKSFNKIILSMVAFLAAIPSFLLAEVTATSLDNLDYAIYAPAISAAPGDSVKMSVCMKNVNAITSWQAELVLPEGVSIANDSYGDPMLAISTARTTATRHSVSANKLANGATIILVSSSSNKTFTGTDGETITITLLIADDAPTGMSAITFNNELLVEANESGHEVAQVISTIDIEKDAEAELYDVTKDGKVDIADVTTIVNYIVKKQQK